MKSYLWNIFVSLDQFVNTVFGPLFNLAFNSKERRFGYPDETISSVVGKMQEKGEGNILVKWLYSGLDNIQSNHCEDNIEKDEGV